MSDTKEPLGAPGNQTINVRQALMGEKAPQYHMKKHKYSDELHEAAESFLINQFEQPSFSSSEGMDQLITAAMVITNNLAWYQPSESQVKASNPELKIK